jgi:hypothetical protein
MDCWAERDDCELLLFTLANRMDTKDIIQNIEYNAIDNVQQV